MISLYNQPYSISHSKPGNGDPIELTCDKNTEYTIQCIEIAGQYYSSTPVLQSHSSTLSL